MCGEMGELGANSDSIQRVPCPTPDDSHEPPPVGVSCNIHGRYCLNKWRVMTLACKGDRVNDGNFSPHEVFITVELET